MLYKDIRRVTTAIEDVLESFGEFAGGEYVLSSKEIMKYLNSDYILKKYDLYPKVSYREFSSRMGNIMKRKHYPIRSFFDFERGLCYILP